MRRNGTSAVCLENLSLTDEDVSAILGRCGMTNCRRGSSEIQKDGIEWTCGRLSLTGYDRIGNEMTTVDLFGPKELVSNVSELLNEFTRNKQDKNE
jgi:hypothetical protein